jgi:hypothetical protein
MTISLVETVKDAFKTANRLQELVTWRTIATAPMDGASIIVAVTGGVNPSGSKVPAVIGEAYWSDGEWWWSATGPKQYATDPISECNYGNVSHWMPLPEAPSEE